MNTQDDNIDKDELLDLSEEEDEEREPHAYKVWVHIEAIDEDGEPIEGDAELPTGICEVATLEEAGEVVAKLEEADVFGAEPSKADVAGMIAEMLDGKEWNVETLDEIADVLRAAGYQVRDINEEE